MRTSRYLLLLLLIVSPALLYIGFGMMTLDLSAYGSIEIKAEEIASSTPSAVEYDTMAFVGDLLYARDVELNAELFGYDYPLYIFKELPLYAGVVANFESSIPKVHRPTPALNTRFSSPEYVSNILFEHGITAVSLANNHSFDFGEAGYEHTITSLENAYLDAFGHPQRLSTSSIAYISVGETKVAVVAINALEQGFDTVLLPHFLKHAAATSDYVVAYVHWGEEYVTVHNRAQQQLAYRLIDLGADAVVGHHPHVVQDIERYAGKPIFYSLGNFVFDQYFSIDVQEGLLLELSFTDTDAVFSLRPVSSIGSRNQPRLMPDVERLRFLEFLAERSQSYLRDDIRAATVKGTR